MIVSLLQLIKLQLLACQLLACEAGKASKLLIKIIKLVYIKIYYSYLKRFDEGIISSIKLHYGEESFDYETKTIKLNGFSIKYPDVNTVIQGKINTCKIINSKYSIN